MPTMAALRQDIFHGFRMLLKKPGFTAIATISLALGIAANTVIFSLIDTTLLRPLPYPDAGRLVMVWSAPLNKPEQRNGVTYNNYMAFRKAHSFESMGAIWSQPRSLGADENARPAEHLEGEGFTPSMFTTLGVKPKVGRVVAEDEDQIDTQAPVVLISERLWQRRFGGDPKVIGQTIRMDGIPITVIGVMPRGFYLWDDRADFWNPLQFNRLVVGSTGFTMGVVARLKPGVALKQAQSELDVIAAQQLAADPDRNKGLGARIQPMTESLYGDLQGPLLILQGAVAFVLLIGCANVAGLLLARAASRRTEIAVRTAIGAGRWRIIRQLITESVPLSLLAGVLGVFLAWGGLKLFVAAAPPGFPRLNEISLDLSVLGFTAFITILTALVFGIAPAIQASKADLVSSLKESGRSGTEGTARQHLRSALVAFQIALALVLLIGAGLMINSFVRIQNNHLGADPRGLLTFEFRFSQNETIKPYGRYRNMGLWDVFPVTTRTFQRIYERMQAVPGVQIAAAASTPPLAGALLMQFLIDGRPAPPPGNDGAPVQQAGYIAITPNYFAALRTPILQGRELNDRDTAAGPPVAIINQTMAKQYWPNESPIGRRITLDYVPNEPSREIVGVVGDVRLSRQQRQILPTVYVPHLQQPARWLGPGWNVRSGMYFILRTTGDPMKLVPAMRQALADVDRDKPASAVQTVEQNLDQQIQYQRLYVLLLGIFGAVAAVLAAIGIYGVMAYSVAERTREIGIRMALGAGAREVLALVVRQALLLIAIGLVVGIAASFALTRVIKTALYEVTPTDPATFIAVALSLTAVALIACFIPTRRAVEVDPTVALRYE
jgi:putative ABC transport system permease protein